MNMWNMFKIDEAPYQRTRQISMTGRAWTNKYYVVINYRAYNYKIRATKANQKWPNGISLYSCHTESNIQLLSSYS
jgi:hypothetical protein